MTKTLDITGLTPEQIDQIYTVVEIFRAINKYQNPISEERVSKPDLNPLFLESEILRAIFELMQEKKEVFSELFVEAIEDIGMKNAIKEGENTEIVSHEEILKILHRQP